MPATQLCFARIPTASRGRRGGLVNAATTAPSAACSSASYARPVNAGERRDGTARNARLFEWVCGQPGAKARRDGGSGGAAGLAPSLALEGCGELCDERQSWVAPQHRRAKVGGPPVH